MRAERVDALVIGAGPAGAAAALNLAPFRRVLLVDHMRQPSRRPGESLVPAARRLLTDMGLIQSFQSLGFSSYYGNDSVWGSDDVKNTSFMSDPDGHGWHIDRVVFERWLRDAAVYRGARLLAPASVESVQRSGDRFIVVLRTPEGLLSVESDFLIDASGRQARISRWLGAVRVSDDPLMCRSVFGASRGSGITFVEAVESGWWYTAPLPGDQRILAFHTDKDLVAIHRVPETLREILNAAGFKENTRWSRRPAGGSALEASCGPGWCAAGDAALTFDPLSSQGLLNALFMGLMAAETAHSYLSGRTAGIVEYQTAANAIRKAYLGHLSSAYAQEQRWPDAPFWNRRRADLIH